MVYQGTFEKSVTRWRKRQFIYIYLFYWDVTKQFHHYHKEANAGGLFAEGGLFLAMSVLILSVSLLPLIEIVVGGLHVFVHFRIVTTLRYSQPIQHLT